MREIMNEHLGQADPLHYVKSYKSASARVLELIPEGEVAQLIEVLSLARERSQQIFLCGNGGSATTASHMANDLGKGASLGRLERFRVVALTDNVSWLTALANDLDYSQVFVEQLKNYARPHDVLVAFSGSGNSPNVIEAVNWANQNEVVTVGVTGRPGGRLGQLASHPVFIESSHMGHIEDAHLIVQHIVSYYFVEGDKPPPSSGSSLEL